MQTDSELFNSKLRVPVITIYSLVTCLCAEPDPFHILIRGFRSEGKKKLVISIQKRIFEKSGIRIIPVRKKQELKSRKVICRKRYDLVNFGWLPAITIVTSPFSFFPSRSRIKSLRKPRCTRSNFFVSSMHTAACRSPRTSKASMRSFPTR